ncbi:MAG: hypothetical protein ACYC8T_19645 [Myxococcaceae bacterium]
MRRPSHAWVVLLAAAACSDIAPGELDKVGQVGGQVAVTPGTRGDAYLFLYTRTPGAPTEAAVPRYLTAVPDARLALGDSRYVFGAVQPNPYRLGAFLDVDGNFQADLDVLAQPGAGDRTAASVELNLQPGEHLALDLAIDQPVAREPPAFRIDGATGDEIQLPDQLSITSFELVLEPLNGTLSKDRLTFAVSLAGTRTNGIPDLHPQVFLRFLPRPGQVVPVDRLGRPATVVVPLTFNPAPFLSNLGGDMNAEIAVDRLQVFLLPQAQAITEDSGKGRVVTAMDAIPVGAYELVMLTRSGQFWRIPNDLAGPAAEKVGGPYPGQGTHFRFVHGSGLDAGF